MVGVGKENTKKRGIMRWKPLPPLEEWLQPAGDSTPHIRKSLAFGHWWAHAIRSLTSRSDSTVCRGIAASLRSPSPLSWMITASGLVDVGCGFWGWSETSRRGSWGWVHQMKHGLAEAQGGSVTWDNGSKRRRVETGFGWLHMGCFESSRCHREKTCHFVEILCMLCHMCAVSRSLFIF